MNGFWNDAGSQGENTSPCQSAVVAIFPKNLALRVLFSSNGGPD